MISQESPTLAESRNLHADKIVLAAVTETAQRGMALAPFFHFLVSMSNGDGGKKEGRNGREGGRTTTRKRRGLRCVLQRGRKREGRKAFKLN